MKFYQIDTDVGPQLVVRKDEAKKLDPKYRQVDIPTDSEGLRTHLNQLMAIRSSDYEVHMSHCGPLNDGVCKYGQDATCPACVAKPSEPQPESKWSAKAILRDIEAAKAKPKQATKLFEPDDIVDVILESRGFQLENYFGAVLEAAQRAKKELAVS